MLRLYSRFPNIAGLARTQTLNASPATALVLNRAAVMKKVGPVAAVGHARHERSFHSSPLSYSPEKKAKDATKTKTKTGKPKAKASKPQKKAEKPEQPKKKRIPAYMKPPKRPATAFMAFYREYYGKQNISSPPQEPIQEVAKRCAQAWKDLTIGERQHYLDQARAAQVEYQAHFKDWLSQTDINTIRKYNKIRRSQGKTKMTIPKEFKGPLRPLTGYMQYANEIRPTMPAAPPVEVVKQIAEKWRALSVEEKERYSAPARQEMREWHAERTEEKKAKKAERATAVTV